mmetsp:Transcript_1100/g.1647  ORF Transcript_1100/g.1647 Transcript_1100/m.1647 type:complete len:84 (+) Transcript_1100:179-430(+)
MELTEGALDFLADVGFDPIYGARPLKRTIQRELETKVAKGILRGDYIDGDTILVDGNDDRLIIEKVIDANVSDEELEEVNAFD